MTEDARPATVSGLVRTGLALLLTAGLLLAGAAAAQSNSWPESGPVPVPVPVSEPVSEPGSGPAASPARPGLSRDFLLGTAPLKAPVPTDAFTPWREAAPASVATATDTRFEGRLVIDTSAESDGFRVIVDVFEQAAASESPFNQLPPFDFEFIQTGEDLIPMMRGRLQSPHPYWEIILEPGKVWHETGDEDWSRAALPFALAERNANCTHNGVLTFLFRPNGQVSRVAYQVGSETCHYFQFDLWGILPARYEPGPVANGDTAIAALAAARAARLPVRPLSRLAEDYLGTELAHFTLHEPSEVSTFGFVFDGVLYSGGCPTRFGPYPFCDSLSLPSYSLAKTLFAATAFMQLEQQFPGARHLRVTDYVPECRLEDGRWDGVTLGHLVDMSSGNYQSTVDQEDEFFSYAGVLFSAGDHAAKIAAACALFPRQAEPGTRWVYHTSETYIAGTLMNAWWKQRNGQEGDIFDDLLVNAILRPLHFSPAFQYSLRTYDAVAQPFTGYGLTLQPDDIARFALFLLESQGQVNGLQVLNPEELAAALQRKPGDPGMTVEAGRMRYNNGVWAATVLPPADCPEPVWIPFMSGYGGISVALLPNGSVYYVFSDGAHFKWAEAAIASHQLKSFCEVPKP